ncbi:MAG TPA: hypothetical protein EYG88_14650 [Desulfocapsa sulfexigens]|nr:hypothetical protein [Desulfocapsa sulfexigens]
MKITDYARQSKLPLKTLCWMVKEKFINDPLDEFDLLSLELLEKVWLKWDFLRPQLLKFSRKDRQALIETTDLKTRWERYAFSRYRNLAAEEKITMKQLIFEIEMNFNFLLNKWQKKRLYQIRQKVYNLRRNEKRL